MHWGQLARGVGGVRLSIEWSHAISIDDCAKGECEKPAYPIDLFLLL